MVRRFPPPIVLVILALVACSGAPWTVADAPRVPPDEQFRTGVEAGHDVYIWNCYEGKRVMITQFGSACFGTRAPQIERGPCGTPLPGEAHFPADHYREAGAAGMPAAQHWPSTDAAQ